MGKSKDAQDTRRLLGLLIIPKSTIYKLVREGKIPGQKIGRHWWFHKNTIDSWLGNHNKVSES